MPAWIKQLAKDLYQAYLNLQEDDGSHRAASVSFYMAVSFFPLLIVLIAATGLLLRFSGWGQDVQDRLFNLIADQTAPALAHQVEAVLSNVQQSAVLNGPIGLLTLFFTSMAVFVHFDDAMDCIWNIQRPRKKGIVGAIQSVLIDRFRAFLMLFAIAIFVIVGFLASMSLSAIGEYAGNWIPIPDFGWAMITLSAAVALNWSLFIVIYKILPKVPVQWSEAVRGAIVASVLWEAGRRLLAALIIGSKFSVYGVVGAFVAIMLWVFYAVTILFLGAEYIQAVRSRKRQSASTGDTVTPDHDQQQS